MQWQWDYPNPFTYEITVKPEHIDGLNHTNNAVYVQWCEEVAWAHSGCLGLGINDYQSLNRAMAINTADYSYLAASFEGEQLTIGTWLTESDQRLTMERRFQLCRTRDQQTLMRGRWGLTCINIETGRPARIPKEFLDVYVPQLVNQPG